MTEPGDVADGRSGRRWRWVWIAAAVIVVMVVAAVVVAPSSTRPPKSGTRPVPVSLHQTTSARAAVAPPGVPVATLVARLRGPAPRSDRPGGPVTGTVAPTWYGEPSILPVVAQHDGYLDVRLQQRPNGSTAWIPATAATLTTTPYVIVIHLSTMRLDLYDQGKQTLSVPAGIGTAQYPTPTGDFFVAFFASPPSPGYGPFVIVTSGHSEAISDWEESGDALVAIHGPLGADAEIGTTGARVSHGCVRLHIPDLERLRDVPAGTPVDIMT